MKPPANRVPREMYRRDEFNRRSTFLIKSEADSVAKLGRTTGARNRNPTIRKNVSDRTIGNRSNSNPKKTLVCRGVTGKK
jgi:hypothetical protein